MGSICDGANIKILCCGGGAAEGSAAVAAFAIIFCSSAALSKGKGAACRGVEAVGTVADGWARQLCSLTPVTSVAAFGMDSILAAVARV